jgi:serine/threonine-protein kinase
MAPEELVRGGTVDERTMVFHMGRTARVLGADPEGRNRLPEGLLGVATRASEPDPARRDRSLEAFARAWAEAGG